MPTTVELLGIAKPVGMAMSGALDVWEELWLSTTDAALPPQTLAGFVQAGVLPDPVLVPEPAASVMLFAPMVVLA